MFYSIIITVHVLVALALVGLILMQHGRGADAGAAFGSGASATVFGSRGSASFLTRSTAILAAVFFVTSLSLAYLTGQREGPKSVTEVVAPAPEVPASTPTDIPSVPGATEATEAGAPEPSAQDLPVVPEQASPGDVPVVPKDD